MALLYNKKVLNLVLCQAAKASQASSVTSGGQSRVLVGVVLPARSFGRNSRPDLLFSSPNKRFQSSGPPESPKQPATPKSSRFLRNTLKYTISILLGGGVGLLTGYYLMFDESQLDDDNEATRSPLPKEFEATKFVEGKSVKYRDFPLTLHLFQYNSCPYCKQIRTYLDYFGFSYYLTEVDGYSKEEISSFTRARQLPILVLEDKAVNMRWHLTNATAIISALESLRNDKHVNFEEVLKLYLPILKAKSVLTTANPFKYHASNSDINSVEWRRWINNNALPAFKLNAISTVKDLFELFDHYAAECDWKLRYNNFFDKFKYYYIYYVKAYRASSEYTKLLEKLDEKNLTPREILHKTVNKWEDGLGDKEFIGDDKPNLADLAMFGSLRAYEGCALFREVIAKHPKLRGWYERMKADILSGYKEPAKKPRFSLRSFTESEAQLVATREPPVDKPAKATQTSEQTTLSKNPSQLNLFRVLTVTYLVHVIAFTYAAWMSK